MQFELTEQQKYAVNLAKKWWKTRDKQVFEISGIAGSGKTTIVYALIEELGLARDDVLFMAYIGKATLALARKGNYAQTIHSTIYDIVKERRTDEDGITIMIKDSPSTRIKFVKKERLPKNIKLLVIDEGAMVPTNIALDILSFDLPVLVLGDINQLPPIFGESFFLHHPDILLTEPMRQAMDSPIIYLAQRAMQGKYISIGKYGEKCFVIKKEMITDKILTNQDIIICGRNKTRDDINNHVRHNILKIKSEYPVVGEKVICRQNNWTRQISDNIFLINGIVGYVEEIYLESYDKRSITIDFRPEFLNDDYFKSIAVDYQYLVSPHAKKNKMRSQYNKFEYAYAITAHLAQGSEYNKVLVYDERVGDMSYYKRWLYTAITRASDTLILAF